MKRAGQAYGLVSGSVFGSVSGAVLGAAGLVCLAGAAAAQVDAEVPRFKQCMDAEAARFERALALKASGPWPGVFDIGQTWGTDLCGSYGIYLCDKAAAPFACQHDLARREEALRQKVLASLPEPGKLGAGAGSDAPAAPVKVPEVAEEPEVAEGPGVLAGGTEESGAAPVAARVVAPVVGQGVAGADVGQGQMAAPTQGQIVGQTPGQIPGEPGSDLAFYARLHALAHGRSAGADCAGHDEQMTAWCAAREANRRLQNAVLAWQLARFMGAAPDAVTAGWADQPPPLRPRARAGTAAGETGATGETGASGAAQE